MVTTRPSTSSRQLRRDNQQVMLEQMWDVRSVTGSDLIAATGLTRATVHDVCDDLIALGWVQELVNQREHGGYRRGRPARRYALAASAGVVLGVDAGEHRATAVVTDLSGADLARRQVSLGEAATAASRRARTAEVVDGALAACPAGARVLAAVVGIPAPVDADGHSPDGAGGFWHLMNAGLGPHLAERLGVEVLVDNDANLAALAELRRPGGQGGPDHVTLLTGERLGAGIVEGGRLLRGRRGRAGEMAYLDLVDGVGSADGIAALVRAWAAPGTREGDVLLAAADGDPQAIAVTDRLGDRFARVVASLSCVLGCERVVLAGGLADRFGPVVERIIRELPRHLQPPWPTVVASRLGAEVVALGAVDRARDHVRHRALDLVLHEHEPVAHHRRGA